MDSYQRPSSPQSAHTSPHRAQGNDEATLPAKCPNEWFYHTKQKKLLRLEAANAFALRDSVLFVLVALAIFILWMIWRTVKWLTVWALHQMVLAKAQAV